MTRESAYTPHDVRRQQVYDALAKRPMNHAEIGHELNISKERARSLIRSLRQEGCPIYVYRYVGTGARPTHMYAYGDCPDAVLDRSVPNDEYYDEKNDAKRLAAMAALIKPFRHPQDEAFFGAVKWSSSTESRSGAFSASQSASASGAGSR